MTTAARTRLDSARTALSSACGEVVDGTPADAVDGVPVGLVARPASTAEVADVLRAAAVFGLVVVPRGHGTKMSWGRPPEQADLVVDLSRMSAVLDHAAGDLIVDTQAGAPLAEVQRTVAAAGQRLALDEPVPGSTIGGVLATNTSGPGRVAVGTARDLLIGVTVVRADGVIAKAGGRVVKNVAGYDLGKLVIGSYGTLAVVTQAVFRLHPVPAARRVVSVSADSPDDAQRLVQQLVHAQLVPAAVEVDWSGTGGTVGVLLEGTEAGVEGRTAAAVALLGGDAAASDEVPAGWGRLPWDEDPTTGRATAFKATFALSGLSRVLEAGRAAAAAAAVPLHLRGSGGEVVTRLREACAVAGGALVVLDGAPEVKAGIDTWGPVPALDLMRRVKEQFDPERRLAPGRFVGGI
jgi:glycolate oxidase FAD binding subunit